MGGDESHLDEVVKQNHERLFAVAQSSLEILGVSGEVEIVALNVILVDRSCDEHVDESVFEVGNGTFERIESSKPGSLAGYSEFDFHIAVGDFNHVVHSVAGFVGGVDAVKLHLWHVESLAVISSDFR